MKNADEAAKMLRRYLLGELNDAEQERLEENFIPDPEFQRVGLTD